MKQQGPRQNCGIKLPQNKTKHARRGPAFNQNGQAQKAIRRMYKTVPTVEARRNRPFDGRPNRTQLQSVDVGVDDCQTA
eukprot:440308-Amphidinium_carterae.1